MIAGVRPVIAGLGYCLPDRIVDNAEIVAYMNTSEAFIVERTGVITRRHVEANQSTADLAVPAARQAVERAGLEMSDIDMLIVNTLSPDHHDPSEACFLQPQLGLTGVPAFDIRAQCSGFLYGLDVAAQYIASGSKRNVLIVCAEVLSKRIDPSDAGRNLAILLADGAAAAVVQPGGANGTGLIDLVTGADGSFFKLLWTAAPGTRNPRFMDAEAVCGARHQFRMNGRAMFEHATDTLVAITEEILRRNRLSLDAIDVLVPHQPNVRILDAVRQRLGVPADKVIVTADRLGNMASASLPIALAMAVEQGRIQRGSLVLLIAYGGGATWGAALYRH